MMKPADMLHAMCQNELSAADIKAISKARGFSAQETGSRALFENFFLSNIGIEAAFAALTEDEIALLHLLDFKGEAVPVHFFDRIYRNTDAAYGYQRGTYNQHYQPVFSQVNARLIRSGVLIYAELGNISAGKTKLERQRFRFPKEFAAYLPRLTQSAITMTGAGDIKDGFRAHLGKLTQPGKRTRDPKRDSGWVALEDGDIMLGKNPFRITLLAEWQQQAWERAVWRAQLGERSGRSSGIIFDGYQTDWDDGLYDISPVPFVLHMMAQLEPDEWLPPAALTALLRVFDSQMPQLPAEKLCEIGWEQGCLARQQHPKQAVYRPVFADQFQPDMLDPAVYFRVDDRRKTVRIDLEKVPYESLEIINQLAELKVNRDQLEASPDVIRISDAPVEVREHPITVWLVDQSATFRDALDRVTSQWGRLIVHQNVLVARVSDLSLRVMLEKRFENHVVVLNDEFIAFPYGLRRDIEKAVDKAGHVVKVVHA